MYSQEDREDERQQHESKNRSPLRNVHCIVAVRINSSIGVKTGGKHRLRHQWKGGRDGRGWIGHHRHFARRVAVESGDRGGVDRLLRSWSEMVKDEGE